MYLFEKKKSHLKFKLIHISDFLGLGVYGVLVTGVLIASFMVCVCVCVCGGLLCLETGGKTEKKKKTLKILCL